MKITRELGCTPGSVAVQGTTPEFSRNLHLLSRVAAGLSRAESPGMTTRSVVMLVALSGLGGCAIESSGDQAASEDSADSTESSDLDEEVARHCDDHNRLPNHI